MDIPTISIAIPTYNRQDLLKKLMSVMISQQTDGRFTYEIIVIDDASTDDTATVVENIMRQSSVPVRYIREKGRGYTGVLNRAVREFRGQWLAFFDDDQFTDSTWLRDLYNAARSQGADMVGGPIILDLPESVLAGIGPVCRDLYGESPDVRTPELYREKSPLPSGGNRLVNRRVFEKIGAFDESMLTGGCDRDFLLRALAAGVIMGWAPNAAGYHLIPPERITYNHVKWYSLQWGCSFAYIDWKRLGGLKTTVLCIARIGKTLLINLPILLWVKMQGDTARILDRQALFWRAAGYTRRTLQMLAPNFFAQENFFSKVEFRRAQENT
jgi:glycosyltransferase involved in cell wall biosynthesis